MPPDPSTPAAADRNLLFGIMALQMDFINRDALITAMNAWALDKAKPLGQILQEQRALRKEDRDLLDVLIKRHLHMHGDNVQKSLASLSSVGSLHEELQKVGDADVCASLAFVQRAGPHDDPYVTRPSTAGQPSVPGQRFRILREHARGGLGAVFVAQDEELHREVALKEIQEKYAHHIESQTRFLLEAEVTGGLEHPGIVPVYGLGRYPDGRPFYAMRFIRGDSLHEAIRRFYAADAEKRDPGERSLAFRELLGQFVAACNALAYAHSRGVLHRDVKPHNIMLGKYGETLLVDWGLAKVMGDGEGRSKSEEGILHPSTSGDSTPTQAGHVMGTPAYMSPEQAEGRLDRLGPTADIYSLGATFYELLTGQQSVQGRHLGEILAKVKRGDWLPPRKMRKDVPAPLEAICRKAMALRPEDRYGSALELAGDIEHWLADEPVSAYREPLSWKLRRWVRRHRGLAAGVAGLLITTVAALAIGIVVVNDQRNRAEQARLETRQTLDEVFSRAIDGWLARQEIKKLEPAQQEFLERARERYRKFADDAGASEEDRAGVAAAYLRLGEIHRWLGPAREAEKAYRSAIEHYKQLMANFPKTADYQRALAKSNNSLGNLLIADGRLRDAERVLREGITLQQQLANEFPAAPAYRQDLARSYNDLANLLKRMGRSKQAEESYRKGLTVHKQLVEQSPEVANYREDLATGYNNLGTLLQKMGRIDEAQRNYGDALTLYQRLSIDSPNVPKYLHRMAITCLNLGLLFRDTGRLQEADTPLREAIALFQRLLAQFPAAPSYRQELATSYNVLGKLLREKGDQADAEKRLREALDMRKQLAEENRAEPSYRQDLARSQNDLGDFLLEMKKPEEAEAAFQAALNIQRKLVAEPDAMPDYANDLAITMDSLAELFRARKDYRQARQLLVDALPHHEAALKAYPESPIYQRMFRYNRIILASVLAGLGEHVAAQKIAAELAAKGWNPAGDAYGAARALAQCISVVQTDAESKRFLGSYVDQALAMLQQAVKRGFKDVDRLRKDKDLEPLRTQPGFQALLKQLQDSGARN